MRCAARARRGSYEAFGEEDDEWGDYDDQYDEYEGELGAEGGVDGDGVAPPAAADATEAGLPAVGTQGEEGK